MNSISKNTDHKTNGMIHDSSEKVQNMTKSLEAVAHNLGTEIGKATSQVSERASGYVKSTRSYVEENPLQSIAIAATAGIVAGSILTLIARRP